MSGKCRLYCWDNFHFSSVQLSSVLKFLGFSEPFLLMREFIILDHFITLDIWQQAHKVIAYEKDVESCGASLSFFNSDASFVFSFFLF